ncbi:MAG: ZIP family metal transporter [Promethearchaeota archaeon]
MDSITVIFAYIAIFVTSIASLTSIFFISLKEKILDKILFALIAFSAGAIISTAFFDLIPEAIHSVLDGSTQINASSIIYISSCNHSNWFLSKTTKDDLNLLPIFSLIFVGFILFYILERFIYWFHGHAHEITPNNKVKAELVCHGDLLENRDTNQKISKKIKPFALLNLAGDGMHNFLDGAIIMVSFSVSVPSGLLVTLAVIFHEIPQEIGDFGILIYGGFTKKKAFVANFLTSLIALAGGTFAYFLSESLPSVVVFFLAISGGGFIYISSAELIPEMMKEKNLKKSIFQTTLFLFGVVLILILLILFEYG